MRQALIDLSAGKANQPLRMVMPFDAAVEPSAAGEKPAACGPSEHGLLFLKPAQLGSALATKLITLVPSNAEKNLPTLLATIVLMDPATGAATAILEGATLTAMRTAAVSAVAADALTPAGPKIVAMLGSGVLARSHAKMLRLVRPVDEIRVWSRSKDNVQACAQDINGRACGSAEEAVRGADIICTVSNAATPILKGAWLKPGALVAAVGAPRPTWRELDDDAMRNIVIADQRQAACGGGHPQRDFAVPHQRLPEVGDGRPVVGEHVRTQFGARPHQRFRLRPVGGEQQHRDEQQNQRGGQVRVADDEGFHAPMIPRIHI